MTKSHKTPYGVKKLDVFQTFVVNSANVGSAIAHKSVEKKRIVFIVFSFVSRGITRKLVEDLFTAE